MEKPKQTKVNNIVAIILLVLFYPLGLIYMWKKTQWGKVTKYSLTALFAGFILLTIIAGSNAPKSSTEQASPTKSAPTSIPSVKNSAVENKTIKTALPIKKPVPTNKPQADNTPPNLDANGFPEDYEQVTVSTISRNPSKYESKKLMFNCTVVSLLRDGSGDVAGINCMDPNDDTAIIQVDISGMDNTKINAEDNATFYGYGEGATSGQNSFGANVTEGSVMGIYVNDTTSGYNNAK